MHKYALVALVPDKAGVYQRWYYSGRYCYKTGTEFIQAMDTHEEAMSEMSKHIKMGLSDFEGAYFTVKKIIYGGWFIVFTRSGDGTEFYLTKDHAPIVRMPGPGSSVERGSNLQFNTYKEAVEYLTKVDFDKELGYVRIVFQNGVVRIIE